MSAVAQQVEIEGRRLTLTNLDKVLYPETGFTKGDMIAYYAHVAPWLLPHLEGRPLTLRRFPNGVEGINWYQTRCQNRPEWLPTFPIPTRAGEIQDFCLVEDVSALVWVANQAAIELHPYLARVPESEQPTVVAFDLDPGAPATLVESCDVALLLRTLLESLGLVSFPKTSGAIGLHVYVPLNTPHNYEQTKGFARTVAQRLAQEHPRLVVYGQKRSLRAGKVLIDWLQNDPTRSTAAPYSLRAAPWPLVSTPLDWAEVERGAAERRPERLLFRQDAVLERLERDGDPFTPVLEVEQALPKLGVGLIERTRQGRARLGPAAAFVRSRHALRRGPRAADP
jgi:bifunctional non-homologous end joining protein LigD